MLVLRRRTGESFLIGDDMEVEILEITPTRVKLGIVAPPSVAITRKEVRLTRDQNVSASRRVDRKVVSWLTGNLTLR